ncbi:hypothetical protein GWI33_016046 [Rhynchophorus ferrugineus]|uniref:Uncharacterized protein n=1 Tax=Rhynchophorus ferrugineus TaxID=354439 RepID=A0A834I1Z7_RHYFE|nr:hypothetical protein GWI33_016046 [Rhynchophorus ferrugineus]
MPVYRTNRLFYLVLGWSVSGGSGSDLQGPVFIIEPAHHVEFGAATGGKIDCAGHGSPSPDVEWIAVDGTTITQVSLYFIAVSARLLPIPTPKIKTSRGIEYEVFHGYAIMLKVLFRGHI